MSTRLAPYLLILSCFTWPVHISYGVDSAERHSIYTSLSEKNCKTLEVDEESGYSKQRCVGAQNFNLIVEDQDGRISMIVVSPDEKNFKLELGDEIGGGITTLGFNAEWRFQKSADHDSVVALVYRVNEEDVSNFDVKQPRIISRLVVVRVGSDRICAVAVIGPGPKQNVLARVAADSAQQAACIKAH